MTKIRRFLRIFVQWFNLKKEREGKLFQGSFKAILIDNEDYLLRVSRYIHLNVLDLIQPDWRREGVKDPQGAFKFLIMTPSCFSFKA